MTHSFAGLPIEGDITRGEKRAHQQPAEDLMPLLQAVIDNADVRQFGWDQCTPYFNDGDPCVFGAGEVWADPVAVAAQEDDEDYDGYHEPVAYDGRWGSREAVYDNNVPYGDPGRVTYADYQGRYEKAYDELMALSNAIESGVFDDVLLESFGDHAQITFRKNKIIVEFFDHD